MYDVEKRSAVLENAAGSECHQHSFRRGSDTSARLRV